MYDVISYKGLGSQTGLFGPVFSPKSKKPLAFLQVLFTFIQTPMCFRYTTISDDDDDCFKVAQASRHRYTTISGPKVMKGSFWHPIYGYLIQK